MSALLLGGSRWDLDMKMQDPALAECWVSITQGCSVTALYLCPPSLPPSLPHHCSQQTPPDRDPEGGAQLLIFCIFAFDDCFHSPDSPNVSHLANRSERDGVVYRQALIYGAVGHLSPLDPTPTQ